MKSGLRVAGFAALVVFFVLAGLGSVASGADGHSALTYATIDIDRIGFEALERLERSEALVWWIEADDRLLVLAGREELGLLSARWRVETLDLPPAPDRLAFVHGAHESELEALGPGVDVLVHAGRMSVVQARPGYPGLPVQDPEEHPERRARFLPFEPDKVLARQWENHRGRGSVVPDPETLVQDLVDQVEPDRWFAAVTDLAGFSRYTHGSEIDDARDWLILQFEDLTGLDVTTQSFQVGGTTAYNVIATWTGTSRPDDWYLVGGHYDATSEDPFVSAPGAEDNASGCAGVLEMARILHGHAPPVTVIYICFSGEEQGLWGSFAHADWLVSTGNDEKVRAMLNMDMIGYTGDADLDCLLETSSAFAGLLETFGLAAERYTTLRIVTSLSPGGSDHVPYLLEGMPALLTIENDWWSYPHYHRTTDLPEHLSLEMGGEILRMNAAVLADLTGVADGDVIFEDDFESGDTSAWQ